MTTPKLPPLPHWCEEGSPFAQQMQAYALAAIEAQGEPDDVGQQLNRLVSAAFRKGELWERCQGRGWPEAESCEFTKLRDETIPDAIAQLQRALASSPPAPQQIGQCDMQIRVLFECVENGVTGTTSAPVKRVEWEDDGTLTAVLDYWPPPAPKQKPLTDEQSRELAEQHYVCSPWYDTNPASVIGSRQWCAYWDGWRAAIGIKGE